MRLDPYILVVAPNDKASGATVLLRTGGYQVTKVADVEQAVADVTRLQPDGVVVDLPPLQAGRVARQIAEACPSIPVVVVTGAPALVDARCVGRAEMASELISAVDRMLVDAAA